MYYCKKDFVAAYLSIYLVSLCGRFACKNKTRVAFGCDGVKLVKNSKQVVYDYSSSTSSNQGVGPQQYHTMVQGGNKRSSMFASRWVASGNQKAII